MWNSSEKTSTWPQGASLEDPTLGRSDLPQYHYHARVLAGSSTVRAWYSMAAGGCHSLLSFQQVLSWRKSWGIPPCHHWLVDFPVFCSDLCLLLHRVTEWGQRSGACLHHPSWFPRLSFTYWLFHFGRLHSFMRKSAREATFLRTCISENVFILLSCLIDNWLSIGVQMGNNFPSKFCSFLFASTS